MIEYVNSEAEATKLSSLKPKKIFAFGNAIFINGVKFAASEEDDEDQKDDEGANA